MVSVFRDFRYTWKGGILGREPGEIDAGKGAVLLFRREGDRGRRVTRPRNTAIWLRLSSLARLQSP